MRTFFVLALPRSRTAWLANLLTYGDSFCFHEGLAETGLVTDLRRNMVATGAPVVGNSDCANVLAIDAIQAEFPDARFIAIRRDPEDVAASLDLLGFENVHKHVEGMSKAWSRAVRRTKCPVYHFDQLDRDACADIWQRLVGTHFDAQRFAMLDHMNVQIDMDYEINRLPMLQKSLVALKGGK